MKIRISVGIYGVPAKLNLDVKILYGKTDQYIKKVFRKEFSLDNGGQVDLPMNFFQEYVDEAIEKKYQDAD